MCYNFRVYLDLHLKKEVIFLIRNGWIFPNGSECELFNSNDSFKEILMCFCRGYRFRDLQKSMQLQKDATILTADDSVAHQWPFIASIIFAVKKLNWIAILNYSDELVIVYSGLEWQKPLIEPYLQHQKVNCYSFGTCEKVVRDYNYLSTILNGERRFLSSGVEFRYDGTDNEDYYVVDNKIRPAPWSKD